MIQHISFQSAKIPLIFFQRPQGINLDHVWYHTEKYTYVYSGHKPYIVKE